MADEIVIIQHSTKGTFHYADTYGILDLGNTLPGAVNNLESRGISATHWLSKDNKFNPIPKAIVRKS